MQVQFSKTFLKWQNDNKSNRVMIDVINRFMTQVFNAPDISQVTPRPKSAGSNLRKNVGTVDEFTLNKIYRIYGKYAEFDPGIRSFRLAVVGIKGNTDQNKDILSALAMFDKGADEEWITFQPENNVAPSQIVSADIAPESSDATETAIEQPVQQKKKSKGKPLDADGLTVAQRKAKRKQQAALEKAAQKQAKIAEQNAARAAAEKERLAAQNRESVEQTKQQLIAIQAAFANDDLAPKKSDIDSAESGQGLDTDIADNFDDDSIQVLGAQPEQNVTVNGITVSDKTDDIAGDVKFEPVADIQYELDIIEHQMNIEASKIIIAEQNIAIERAKIQREMLAIKKLQLLQSRKNNQPQQ